MPKPSNDPKVVSYRPSAYYFRKALREATDAKELRAVGMTLCSELEALKAWVRDQGLIPPRFFATEAEATEKSWPEQAAGAPAPSPDSAA